MIDEIYNFFKLILVFAMVFSGQRGFADDSNARFEYRVYKRKTSTVAHFISFVNANEKIQVSECELDYKGVLQVAEKFDPTLNFEQLNPNLIKCTPLGPEVRTDVFQAEVQKFMQDKKDKVNESRWSVSFAGINVLSNIAMGIMTGVALWQGCPTCGAAMYILLFGSQVIYITSAIISTGYRTNQTISENEVLNKQIENNKASPMKYEDILGKNQVVNDRKDTSAIFLDINDYNILKQTWESTLNKGGFESTVGDRKVD